MTTCPTLPPAAISAISMCPRGWCVALRLVRFASASARTVRSKRLDHEVFPVRDQASGALQRFTEEGGETRRPARRRTGTPCALRPSRGFQNRSLRGLRRRRPATSPAHAARPLRACAIRTSSSRRPARRLLLAAGQASSLTSWIALQRRPPHFRRPDHVLRFVLALLLVVVITFQPPPRHLSCSPAAAPTLGAGVRTTRHRRHRHLHQCRLQPSPLARPWFGWFGLSSARSSRAPSPPSISARRRGCHPPRRFRHRLAMIAAFGLVLMVCASRPASSKIAPPPTPSPSRSSGRHLGVEFGQLAIGAKSPSLAWGALLLALGGVGPNRRYFIPGGRLAARRHLHHLVDRNGR